MNFAIYTLPNEINYVYGKEADVEVGVTMKTEKKKIDVEVGISHVSVQ